MGLHTLPGFLKVLDFVPVWRYLGKGSHIFWHIQSLGEGSLDILGADLLAGSSANSSMTTTLS